MVNKGCACCRAYCWSWGPIGWLYPTEISTLETRSCGLAVASFCNLLFSAVLAQTFLTMLCSLQVCGCGCVSVDSVCCSRPGVNDQGDSAKPLLALCMDPSPIDLCKAGCRSAVTPHCVTAAAGDMMKSQVPLRHLVCHLVSSLGFKSAGTTMLKPGGFRFVICMGCNHADVISPALRNLVGSHAVSFSCSLTVNGVRCSGAPSSSLHAV